MILNGMTTSSNPSDVVKCDPLANDSGPEGTHLEVRLRQTNRDSMPWVLFNL